MTQAPTPAVFDSQLHAIAHRHRRAILHELLDRPPDSDAALDLETVAQAGDASMVELYHQHVPKLADCGLVRWDAEERTVTRGPAFQAVRPLLERLGAPPGEPVGQ